MVIAPDLSILESRFYVVTIPEAKKPLFTEARTVSLKDKQSYGWALRIKTDRKKLKYTEVLVAPAPLTHWGIAKNTSISKDRKTATSNREWIADTKWLGNFWGVSPSDPPGNYEFRISIDGIPVQTYGFTIQ